LFYTGDRVEVMQTVAEYEQVAAECRRLAAQMQQKKQMEEMAELRATSAF
jgi:hypothetical protein